MGKNKLIIFVLTLLCIANIQAGGAGLMPEFEEILTRIHNPKNAQELLDSTPEEYKFMMPQSADDLAVLEKEIRSNNNNFFINIEIISLTFFSDSLVLAAIESKKKDVKDGVILSTTEGLMILKKRDEKWLSFGYENGLSDAQFRKAYEQCLKES